MSHIGNMTIVRVTTGTRMKYSFVLCQNRRRGVLFVRDISVDDDSLESKNVSPVNITAHVHNSILPGSPILSLCTCRGAKGEARLPVHNDDAGSGG